MIKRILMSVLIIMGAAMVVCAAEDKPVRDGNTIAGHVIELETEEGLPFATVKIVETGAGTTTDENGNFLFKHIPEGEYTLRAEMMGFVPLEKKVTVRKEFAVDVHFALEEIALDINEVVVSANRNEVSRKDAPVVVNVLGEKLFETTNTTDLAKALNYQSGMRVENNCQNCGFPQVRINGLEGPYSQILINSRPIISALSGVYGLEQIPVNMIERVEVVRGGGSALFGANAVGGTINIITKDPINNSYQVASTLSNANGKSWEQYMGANASLAGKDNVYGLALYQTYRNRNPYDDNGDGFSEIGKLNMNTFGLRG
ncbi:MAG: TonB-dependent receptor, partial [Bacteroidaceae bacterium]|nr:TonB-dependent receptor [Bacteroidaceae bacterium]